MTKIRRPESIAGAVRAIIEHLGIERAAAVVDRSPRTLYAWSDPDADHAPSLDQAIKLDRAAVIAGMGEPPIGAVYAQRVEEVEPAIAALSPPDRLARVIAEIGDVGRAIAGARRDGRTTPAEAAAIGAEISQAREQLATLEREIAALVPTRVVR